MKKLKKLMYAPTIYQWDTDRIVAPETWYYQWHKVLYAYFAHKPGLSVLWKAGKGNVVEDPVKHWMARNITYSTMPMGRALDNVDGVFVDTVSNTVIWDAAKARVPVLCCYLRTDRRILLPIEGQVHMYYCPAAQDAFGWLDRFIAGELKPRFLKPSRSDWLVELERDYGNRHNN